MSTGDIFFNGSIGVERRKGGYLMARNPYREGNNPQEPDAGENITNLHKRKILRIRDEDGNITREILIGARETIPDGTGGYIDIDYVDLPIDSAGNSFPKDPRDLLMSHTNLFIPSKSELARCTSRFHPSHITRNIYVGLDGKETKNGAVCSRCDYWYETIYIALGIIGLGIVIGLLKGAGIF